MRTNRNLIEFDAAVVRRRPLTSQDRADLPRIAARHETVRQLGFPVPRILEVHDDHLVLERAAGTPLMETALSRGAQRRVGAQVAEILSAMRAITQWPLPTTAWPLLWQRLHEVAQSSATAAAARAAEAVTPTLTHGDLSAGNLLVSDNGFLHAVIDWDGATLADPAQDYTAACANVLPAIAEAITAATPTSQELQRRSDTYMATWADQDRLWRAGRHPWIPQESASP